MKPSRVLLIDCSAVCYRALYTSGHLKTSEGVPSGIVFGFFNILYKLCCNGRAAHFAFCWDSQQSHRKQLFPEYKGNREHTPEIVEAFKQFKTLRTKILPTLGFANNFFKVGYEADDLIASLCTNDPPNESQEYCIVSADHDLYQLLTPRICMWEPSTRVKKYTYENFCEQWQAKPDIWGLAKCYAGCRTDGVPGIPGVAEKTAIKHLTVKPLPRLQSPEAQKIVARNEPLVVLPFASTPKLTLNWRDKPDYSAFIDMCHEYEFRTFLNRRQIWRDIFNGTIPGRIPHRR